MEGGGVSALFVVEVSFAITSLEHPEPSDATLTAAPMFMINSLLFILGSPSWLFLVYFANLQQSQAESVLESKIVPLRIPSSTSSAENTTG